MDKIKATPHKENRHAQIPPYNRILYITPGVDA